MIDVRNLSVAYGAYVAVNDISFTVGPGDIYGFIGANGAGKTTTMRVMATLMAPASGSIAIAGYDVLRQPHEVRRCIGYLPDFFGAYDNLRVWEYLDFFADAYEVPRPARPAAFDRVLALTRLEVKRHAFVDHLSRGMKQRLGLARALLHQPQLLILDEPASGLDPHARVEFRDILCELARTGVTIFISSHILTELSGFCTRACMLEAGRVIAEGTTDAIARFAGLSDRVILEAAGTSPAILRAVLAGLAASVEQTAADRYQLSMVSGTDVRPRAVKALVDAGIRIAEFRIEKTNLEDVFMRLSKGELA